MILCLWMFSCLCKALCLRTIPIYLFCKKILSAQLPCGIKKPSDFNRQENGRKVDFLRRVSQERLNWRAKIWEKYVELPEQIFWGVWQIFRSCQRWFHGIWIERELRIESFIQPKSLYYRPPQVLSSPPPQVHAMPSDPKMLRYVEVRKNIKV